MEGLITFGGVGSQEFTMKWLSIAVVVLLLLPMGLTLLTPGVYNGATQDEVLEGYERFTGQKAATSVSVWPLTGIYLPFTGGSIDDEGNQVTYGYTEDGWLYGSELRSYAPEQYRSTTQQYTVYKDDHNVFRYLYDSDDYNEDLGTGHRGTFYLATQQDVQDGKAENIGDPIERKERGELYTDVNFDVYHKSDIFFIESSRQEDTDGHFYYDYSGYRMAFQPISSYTAQDQDGNKKPVIATTTSLSLVWYEYLNGQSGITGQLVLSGSNGGIAYLNAAQILAAFNNNTSTAAFDMVFNGVKMTIYIKIDVMYLSSGDSVEKCYNEGHWSIMVTSLSVESTAYTGTDDAINPMKMIETMIDLLTFNLDDYNISPWMAQVISIIYIAPLYVALISLLLDKEYLWILMGIMAAAQALAAFDFL